MLSIMVSEVSAWGEHFGERKTIVCESPQMFYCLVLWSLTLSLFVIPLVHLAVATGKENKNYLATAGSARPGSHLLLGTDGVEARVGGGGGELWAMWDVDYGALWERQPVSSSFTSSPAPGRGLGHTGVSGQCPDGPGLGPPLPARGLPACPPGLGLHFPVSVSWGQWTG